MRAGTHHPPTSAAFCPLHSSGTCRSCPHQDVPLDLQLHRKQQRVAALLASAARPVPDGAWLAPVASAPTRFRNKAKMVVSGRAASPILGVLGPDGGIDLRECPLHVSEIEAALPALARTVSRLGLGPYDVRARRGELKHILVTASPDGDLMVRWVLRSHRHVERLRSALPGLREALPTLAVMSVNIQPVHQAIIEGEEELILTEDIPWGDRLLMRLRLPEPDGGAAAGAGASAAARASDTTGIGARSGEAAVGAAAGGRSLPDDSALRWRAGEAAVGAAAGSVSGRGAAGVLVGTGTTRSPGIELPLLLPTRSFFQTNTGVAEALYATATHWARDLSGGAEVWDLFCGVGGFALALAGPGRRVLGVEVSAPAIRGARESAALMGLPSEEVRFEVGDARVLDPGGSAVPDLLVVNPPRRGIGTGLARRIENSSAARVLYSSCNPVSLAADLEAMPSLRARRARLFDMFPHTDHAEVLVELVRRPPSRTAPSPTQTSSARAASTSTRRASTSAAA